MSDRSFIEEVAFWMLVSLVFLCGFGVGSVAHAKESVDQYLDRMRMRRDNASFQKCTDELIKRQMSGEENVGFCVPPDYATDQEAWRSGEWTGTEV